MSVFSNFKFEIECKDNKKESFHEVIREKTQKTEELFS